MADVTGQAVGSVHAGLHIPQDIMNHGKRRYPLSLAFHNTVSRRT